MEFLDRIISEAADMGIVISLADPSNPRDV